MDLNIQFHGKEINVSSGKLAKNADGSVVVKQGGTSVLATVCISQEQQGISDTASLRVFYQEPLHIFGRIPGGYFKRDGRPTERETLISRLIDRPIRPMIKQYYTYDTQLCVEGLSYDGLHDPASLAGIASSFALAQAGVPVTRHSVTVRCMLQQNGNIILFPNIKDMSSDCALYCNIAVTRDGISMIELQSSSAKRDDIMRVVEAAYKECQPLLDIIESNAHEIDYAFSSKQELESINELLAGKELHDMIKSAANTVDKKELRKIEKDILLKVSESIEGCEPSHVQDCIKQAKHGVIKGNIFSDSRRGDGRSPTDLRKIEAEVDLFSHGPHGTALFTRGGTQVMTSTVLGGETDEQSFDLLGKERKDKFILHYNFPPYSVGEVGRVGAPGRREIGHGALAKKSIIPVLPYPNFDYTIRSVANVLASDGSSSMGTVCSCSMSLMSAGVPIKSHVSGIAMGAVIDGIGKHKVLTDISGIEDGFSEMDFKISGTDGVIHAIQMDIKSSGVSLDILGDAIDQSQDPRMEILGIMNDAISSPNKISLSSLPTEVITINKDKIKNVIGTGGSNIKRICSDADVKVDVKQDGKITIQGKDQDGIELAKLMIQDVTSPIKVGNRYRAEVVDCSNGEISVRFILGRERGTIKSSDRFDVGSYVFVDLKKRAPKQGGVHSLEIHKS